MISVASQHVGNHCVVRFVLIKQSRIERVIGYEPKARVNIPIYLGVPCKMKLRVNRSAASPSLNRWRQAARIPRERDWPPSTSCSSHNLIRSTPPVISNGMRLFMSRLGKLKKAIEYSVADECLRSYETPDHPAPRCRGLQCLNISDSFGLRCRQSCIRNAIIRSSSSEGLRRFENDAKAMSFPASENRENSATLLSKVGSRQPVEQGITMPGFRHDIG